MRYLILAAGPSGSIESVEVDAPDEAAARRQVATAGLAVIEIAERAARSRRPQRGAFRLELFCQELLALLGAGISVGEALETLAAKDGADGVVAGLLRTLQEGRPLSAAMAARPDVFPLLLVESMRASERTSDYEPALSRFVAFRRMRAEVRGKLLTASIYPLLLLGVSSAVLLFLLGYVVPRFADIYADMGDRLPAASRVMLWLGQGIHDHPVLLLAAAGALAAAGVFAWRTPALHARALRLARRLPRIDALLMAADASRMYRTLALLLHGGVALVPALGIVRGLLPLHLQPALDACRQALREGQGFAAGMQAHGLATVVADRFIRVGEQTGRLAEMLDRAAEFHEIEIARIADWTGRVVGPVLMLLMGALIGVMVVLMYLPIFQLTESLQ